MKEIRRKNVKDVFWEYLGGAWPSGDAGFTIHKFSACVCRLEGAALGRSRGCSEVVFGGYKLKPDTVTANHRAFPPALITRLKVLETVTAADKQEKERNPEERKMLLKLDLNQEWRWKCQRRRRNRTPTSANQICKIQTSLNIILSKLDGSVGRLNGFNGPKSPITGESALCRYRAWKSAKSASCHLDD